MIRPFFKWFLRFVFVAVFIVLVGFILYLWKPWVNSSGAPTETETKLVSAMTAKEAQQVAEPIAMNWAGDAQLVSLSSTWDANQPFQAGEGDWSLLYYSPTQAATALISVINGAATVVGSHGVGNPITVSPDNRWRIDSPVAIDQLIAAGGDDFLRSQPDATVSLSLDLSRDAMWRVRLIDQMSRRVFAVRVSFDNGEIIDVQQTG
ncbi:MAG: hypothetical protein PVG33_18160 [Chloroflexota bacterium]|jgi:magnesium-transporting ATPase (P-type)